jgi:hypothetical protein
MAMMSRLADVRLWADGVGAIAQGGHSLDHRFQSRPNDLMLVKSLLIMLGDFVNEYADILGAGSAEGSDEALQHIDSTIENLAIIGVAIRRTGKASRRRKADVRFDPTEHSELRQHLEALILMRPSEAGLRAPIDAKELTVVQKRLIDANLRRRHRFVLAQKRSKGLRLPGFQPTERVAERAPTEEVPDSGLTGKVKGRTLERVNRAFNQVFINGIPADMASQSHASTAEGSLQYQPRRKFTPGVARTQITALAAEADFPRPPRPPDGRLIGKCPCCCQSMHRDDLMNPERWR